MFDFANGTIEAHIDNENTNLIEVVNIRASSDKIPAYNALYRSEVGEAEIVKNGISCSILFSGTVSSLTKQTAKHASMNAEKTR